MWLYPDTGMGWDSETRVGRALFSNVFLKCDVRDRLGIREVMMNDAGRTENVLGT